jgi:hypothetical protein
MSTGSEEGQKTLQLDKGESVYSYTVFLPPVVRHKYGSLYNWEMFIGLFLLVLNVAMQVGMTYIVGQGVLVEGNAWRYSLVGVDVEAQLEEGQVAKDAEQEITLLGLGSYNKRVSADDPNPEDVLGLHYQESQSAKASLRALSAPSKTKPGHISPLIPNDTVQFMATGAQKPAGGKGGAASTANKAGDGDAMSATLCKMHNATYNCLPPSVKFAARWEDLDTNGDGIWTREEAEKDQADLEKKLFAKPFLVFRAITIGLVDRQPMDSRLWVDPKGMVAKMEGIPKAYFDYWMGDAAICSFADPGMCSTLLSRKIFEQAFVNPGKEIADIDGALDYCTYMLKVGGGCDQSLPQIYKLYRALRHEQCGAGHFYAGGLYKNPHNPTDKVYIISQAYEALDKHIKADSSIFGCFMFLVLMLWLLALVNEMREMIKLGEFCAITPSAKEDGGLEVSKNEDGDETFKIVGLTTDHRIIIALTVFMRTVVIIYLGIVGCTFLILETGYMDLLMNAVALAFVLEVDEILFGAIARASTVDTLEAIEEIEFETVLPTGGCLGWMLLKDFWGIIMFPMISILIIVYHSLFVTSPILDALNCACYQTGSQCKEAKTYDLDFWNLYFSQTLPAAMKEIASLKAAAGF